MMMMVSRHNIEGLGEACPLVGGTGLLLRLCQHQHWARQQPHRSSHDTARSSFLTSGADEGE